MKIAKIIAIILTIMALSSHIAFADSVDEKEPAQDLNIENTKQARVLQDEDKRTSDMLVTSLASIVGVTIIAGGAVFLYFKKIRQ